MRLDFKFDVIWIVLGASGGTRPESHLRLAVWNGREKMEFRGQNFGIGDLGDLRAAIISFIF